MSFLKALAKSEPYRGASPAPQIIVHKPSPPAISSSPGRASWVFDSHVTSEASSVSRGAKNPQAVSLAWDERGQWGFDLAQKSPFGMTPRERKETLLQIFLANPWASSCIDTIGSYIASGGHTIEPAVDNPSKLQYDKIKDFLMRVNDDWEITGWLYDQLTDELIFGEAFTEFTMYKGVPYELFPVDCITMDTIHDRFGRVTEFRQQSNSTTQINHLKPDNIIRWWHPHKRAKVDPFSPLERMQDAILLDKKMVNWSLTFFAKGAKYDYYYKGLSDKDEADRFLTWMKENYTGEKNAHIPVALWGNADFGTLGKGGIDIDFDKGLTRNQVIVCSTFHVPPSVACIAEVGNRLTDMSDSQRKILQYIACDPRKIRFFQKFNYRLIHPYFGTDWNVSSRYAEFRGDKEIAEEQNIRVNNGTLTRDEARQEGGREPYKDNSGSIATITTTREILPVSRLSALSAEQAGTAQAVLDKATADAELAQEKAKQAKEPLQPVPAALQKAAPGVASGEAPEDEEEPGGKDDQEESLRRRQFEESLRRGLCLKS